MMQRHEIDALIDTTAINKKMADRADNPYRWRVGSFFLPKGISEEMRSRLGTPYIQKFIEVFAKQGWKLESKVQIYGPFPARSLEGAYILDMEEWRVRAVFSTKPEPMRIEVPAGLVRQSPEQTITVKEAIRA